MLGAILAMVVAYEQARWDETACVRKLLKLANETGQKRRQKATTFHSKAVITDKDQIVRLHNRTNGN
ncbi:hypothetical protein O9992_15980 [Vibrio lentus]|nr:hypothetical protein [Vibrio lentus]